MENWWRSRLIKYIYAFSRLRDGRNGGSGCKHQGASDSDLLLFELTRDYRIVLPLMAAVGLSVHWWSESSQIRLLERISAGSKCTERPADGNFAANSGGGGNASVAVDATSGTASVTS